MKADYYIKNFYFEYREWNLFILNICECCILQFQTVFREESLRLLLITQLQPFIYIRDKPHNDCQLPDIGLCSYIVISMDGLRKLCVYQPTLNKHWKNRVHASPQSINATLYGLHEILTNAAEQSVPSIKRPQKSQDAMECRQEDAQKMYIWMGAGR